MKNIEERPKFLKSIKGLQPATYPGEIIYLDKKINGYVNTSGFNISLSAIDKYSDNFQELKTKEIEIKMVIETHSEMTEELMTNWFIRRVENMGWTCGGSVKELDE